MLYGKQNKMKRVPQANEKLKPVERHWLRVAVLSVDVSLSPPQTCADLYDDQKRPFNFPNKV